MQPNNLTALDFEDIKSSIRSYLRTRKEFSDYDFEGSSLSYLIDLLAYNTYYTSFGANMAMNEAFISSATLRDNIVNIAKVLNYNPRSVKSAYAFLHLKIQTRQVAGSYPSNLTLLTGATATGGNYTWNRLDPYTVSVDQTTGIAEMRCVKIYEGTIVTDSFVVDTFANQRYLIDNENVDVSTLSVSVRANESSTNSDVYNLVENVTVVASTDRVYFLSETEDMRYELRFGDGVIGKKLGNGEVIDIEYLTCSGSAANGVKNFNFIGTLEDNQGEVYGVSDVITKEIAEYSAYGDEEESIESIKYNAPRWYSSQYRAVTALDYQVITKKLYPNAQTVVAFGGDELNPPIYGKVFIGIKTKSGTKINEATKKLLSQQLKPYAMASITPVIRDVESIYINPKIFLTYDSNCSDRSVSTIATNAQNAITDWARQSGISNFNGIFSLTKLQQAIAQSDKCISDISTQITLLKYVGPTAGQTNTYCVSTGSPIFNSAPSTDTITDSTSCPKEPVVKSGRFRTLDRPLVDQYFEDDGYGSLRTYYNSGNRKVITNTKAGTINYESGQICLGPISIIGTGVTNLPTLDGTDITTLNVDSDFNVEIDTSPTAIANLGDLSIPVVIIPANSSTILTPDPSTTIDLIVPTISVSPTGSTLPSTIPLNSLNPLEFEVLPSIIDIPDITNPGNLSTNTCF